MAPPRGEAGDYRRVVAVKNIECYENGDCNGPDLDKTRREVSDFVMPQWTCPICNIIMEFSGQPCSACGRDRDEAAREANKPILSHADIMAQVDLEMHEANKLAASRRTLREAQKAAHIQGTVARAEAEAKRGSHPASEAEIWKGIVEKDNRISKQLETLCFWARIIGIPFLIAAAIEAIKFLGDLAKEIHGS